MYAIHEIQFLIQDSFLGSCMNGMKIRAYLWHTLSASRLTERTLLTLSDKQVTLSQIQLNMLVPELQFDAVLWTKVLLVLVQE